MPKNNTKLLVSQLVVSVGGKKGILADSGSINTFMGKSFAVKSGCTLIPTVERKVTVAAGGSLISDTELAATAYQAQGVSFSNPFKFLQLKSYDIILGADWIYEDSPIGLDLVKRIFIITKRKRRIIFRDIVSSNSNHLLPADKLPKISSKCILGFLLEINEMDNTQVILTDSSDLSTEVE